MTLSNLAQSLRESRGVRHKLDIRQFSGSFASRASCRNGDDCAAIPDGSGHLLFAIEGMIETFVAAEPWFAGYSAVMVNASDIYAMGGRPLAVVDAIWARSAQDAQPVWDGMTAAADKYQIPIVGGHSNCQSGGNYLAAAMVGRAGANLLTSFDARPGDSLIYACDQRGEWFGAYPFWNCSTTAAGERLRDDLELLPVMAEQRLCRAAKDVSMAGLVGTATMLAECSGVGLDINLDEVPKPPGVPLEKWLMAFPSYGFLLAVAPSAADEVCRRFADRSIAAAVIGSCNGTRKITLSDNRGGHALFWDLHDKPFMGFAE